jgi:hypothetical protein
MASACCLPIADSPYGSIFELDIESSSCRTASLFNDEDDDDGDDDDGDDDDGDDGEDDDDDDAIKVS